MLGVTSNKSRADTKDYFRVLLNNRSKNEPNFIWPIETADKPKRPSINEESTTDSYVSSFKSIYADEILVKQKTYKTADQPRENTFDTIFGNSVRGYSINNTQAEKESAEVFAKTTTLQNEPDVRQKDKIRRQQMTQSKAPMPLRQDLIDLILSKAQAIDSTFVENVDSDSNSLANGSTSDTISSPRPDPNTGIMWISRAI